MNRTIGIANGIIMEVAQICKWLEALMATTVIFLFAVGLFGLGWFLAGWYKRSVNRDG